MSLAARIRAAAKALTEPSKRGHRRSFDAATGSRRGFGLGTAGPINPEVGMSLERVRRRARYLHQNNPWIRNAIDNWVGQAVGAGIKANSAHPNQSMRVLLDKEFQRWATSADSEGRTNWAGIQSDVFKAMVVDGEAFVQKIISQNGLQLRQIPSEQVDMAKTVEMSDGGLIVQGVEFDAQGVRVAYWIHPAKPISAYQSYAPSERVSADQILHVFKPLAPGQVRGISWLAPIVVSANDFDQLTDALLVNTKVAALMSAWIVDPNGTGALDLDADALSTASLEPGVVRCLPAGTDIRFSSPKQTQEVKDFIKLNLHALAAGLGLPTFLLSNDLSDANYSSLRAGLLPFRARCEAIQKQVLEPQLLGPVWRAVVAVNILSGIIEAPDFETNRAEYDEVDWLPPRPMQVDPQKEIEAVKQSLEIGITSRRRAVASTGCNVEGLDSEIAADRARETELGLNFSNGESNAEPIT